MKIALLLPDLRAGGAERVMVDLAAALAQKGCEIEFVLRQERGQFLEEVQKSWRVVDLAAPRVREVPRRLSRYLRSAAPAALIANMWPLTTAAVVARWLAGSGPRLAVVDHGMLSAAYAPRGPLHNAMMRNSIRLSYPCADAVVAVSRGVAQDVARLAGLDESRVRVIHNPIPPKPWPSEAAIKDANAMWSAGPRRVLSVGTLKTVKNFPLLLKALALLPREAAQLMIVGGGDEEANLRQVAGQLGLTDRVIFAGHQPDPSAFYATADLFALSSNHEGFGNVLVEALSFGCPVVSTDCPAGPAEILEDGKWGRLVPVGDADALAQGIFTSLQAGKDPEALRRRAADFRPEIAAQHYLDALELS